MRSVPVIESDWYSVDESGTVMNVLNSSRGSFVDGVDGSSSMAIR